MSTVVILLSAVSRTLLIKFPEEPGHRLLRKRAEDGS